MGNAGIDMPNWKHRLVLEFKRDKKRATVLAVLLLVACAVGARMLLSHPAPRTAAAASRITPGRMSQLPPTGIVSDPPATRDGRSAEQIKRDSYLSNIDSSITRDIFLPNSACFPPQQAAVSRSTSDSTDGERDTGAVLRDVVRAQAQALTLQSTIVSHTPTAIINGRVLRNGDWISGFMVVEITSHSCIVEKDNIKISLEMKN